MIKTHKPEGPGEILRLEVPISVSVTLILAVAILTIVYSMWTDARSTIKFLGASIGVAAGVLSAYYIGRGLRVTIEQRDRALTDEKISRAFGLLSRWNDPNFAELRKKWRVLLEEIEGKTDDQVCEVIAPHIDKRTVIADVLNFYEEMGYAARSGVVDLETLKQLFKSIVIRYYTSIRPWIEKYRKEKHQETAFEHFEWLKKQWERS